MRAHFIVVTKKNIEFFCIETSKILLKYNKSEIYNQKLYFCFSLKF